MGKHRFMLKWAWALALVAVAYGVSTWISRVGNNAPVTRTLAAPQNATVRDTAPPPPVIEDASQYVAYLQWAGAISQKLKDTLPDAVTRREFLQTVWFESHRAGLDTALVMGVIETVSNFRKFHVAENGSRGYMGISPHWVQVLGDGDAGKLFHMQTNLRFGCVLLRNYLDERQGDLSQALADYHQGNLNIEGQSQSPVQFVDLVLANKRRW